MAKIGNISVKHGSYEKDGETKNNWVNVGALMENDNGMYVLLDPTINLAAFERDGKRSVIASVFKNNNDNDVNYGGL